MINPAVELMLKRYRCKTRPEYERALKEILQEIALVGLWRARFFEHAAFYGGTALRILYGLDRFSEDMDFTLLHPNPTFSLDAYNEAICSELTSYGFTATVNTKNKEWRTAICSAFIKTETLGELLKIGVPSHFVHGLHPNAQIKIKIEVDTDPPPAYATETRFLVRPINIGIRTVVLEDIFAGKMHALLFRQWKERVKGRDWYDWAWLVRHEATLSLSRFATHMQQAGTLALDECLTREMFEQMLYKKIDAIDVMDAQADVSAFLANPKDITDWSRALFRYLVVQTKTGE